VTTYVIDASVAVKWVLPAKSETLTAEALELLQGYVGGRIRFIVPDLFWPEVGNVLWKATRQRRLPASTSEASLRAVAERQFPTIPSLVLLEDAFAIAIAFERTFYDALYVALAVRSRSHLITADEKLANAVAAYLPVKWLGSL
jgi:predicted nucleic acid-binding protein